MPYNIELEQKLDQIAGTLGTVDKKKMFGGVGYMLHGNMVFGIHKQALLIRTSPEKAEELLRRKYVSVFDMTGRPMKGWLLVSPEGWQTEKQLKDYLDLAIQHSKSLPKKYN